MSKISSETLAASISPLGYRLITLRVTFPRIILPEFLTHRIFSRNFSSNRAIPLARTLDLATFTPMHWGKAQRGMQATEDQADPAMSREMWLRSRDVARGYAQSLASLFLHKQTINRVLEPYQWVTGIVSFTSEASGEYPGQSFFAQRTSLKAEPHIYELAWCMADSVFSASYQKESVHCPLVSSAERREVSFGEAMLASAMRCARVSYNNLLADGHVKEDAQAAKEKLLAPGDFHGSPFEHQACLGNKAITSNFRGDWLQYRVLVAQSLARKHGLQSFDINDYKLGRQRKIQ